MLPSRLPLLPAALGLLALAGVAAPPALELAVGPRPGLAPISLASVVLLLWALLGFRRHATRATCAQAGLRQLVEHLAEGVLVIDPSERIVAGFGEEGRLFGY